MNLSYWVILNLPGSTLIASVSKSNTLFLKYFVLTKVIEVGWRDFLEVPCLTACIRLHSLQTTQLQYSDVKITHLWSLLVSDKMVPRKVMFVWSFCTGMGDVFLKIISFFRYSYIIPPLSSSPKSSDMHFLCFSIYLSLGDILSSLKGESLSVTNLPQWYLNFTSI